MVKEVQYVLEIGGACEARLRSRLHVSLQWRREVKPCKPGAVPGAERAPRDRSYLAARI